MFKERKNPACPICGATTIGYSVDDDEKDTSKINWVCTRSPSCKGLIKANNKVTQKNKKATENGVSNVRNNRKRS